jgi:hypothetical protein
MDSATLGAVRNLSHNRWHATILTIFAFLIAAQVAWGSVTGSISGVVHDSSGAVLPGLQVIAQNTGTGIQWTSTTDARGLYSFQALPVGTYDIKADKEGFKGFLESGLVLTLNAALTVDITLEVGKVVENVTVASNTVHVEETSTQMGEVIDSEKITSVPLVTRSYTDLLALQPGVIPVTSGLSGGLGGEFTSVGFAINQPSGDLNAGNLSVNGMREGANAFLLNGASVEEAAFHGTAAIPNLDSIDEFRILTNNFDAEYGSYAGGQINVVTKSGTNKFHGSGFEFLRNNVLNSRNYFDPPGPPGDYKQNQFGGTIGGPILHDKLFFFGDYQGNRKVFGQSTGAIPVPSDAERAGDFSAPGLSSTLTGTVQGPYWAQQLGTVLGYTVTQGEPYYVAGCTSGAQCVFPNAMIPSAAFTTPSVNVLPYIPKANSVVNGIPTYTSAAAAEYLRDDKFGVRGDGNTRFGLISAYFFWDNYVENAPNPVTPSFTTKNTGRVDVANLSATKTFGSTAVNEARIAYTRLFTVDFSSGAGLGPGETAALGFTGIVPVQPAYAGVPGISFNNFSTGNSGAPSPIIQNTYEAMDNYSKIIGAHSLKFGGSYRFNMQIWKNLGSNGAYNFNGSETGIDFADYLIGAPQAYQQGQGYASNGRNLYFGLYGQDSWRLRSNLTVNFGLRYEIATPWWEEHNEIQTLVPGLQSLVFPGSPTGWVFPGDPGIPKTLAPIRYGNFAPRLGLAYSPATREGFLGKLTGGPGNSSIRVSWGKFFTTFEGATDYNEIGDAPFGFYWGSPVPPEFANPFIDRGSGFNNGQRFPAPPPPYNVSAKNPDNSVNWANFLPIGSSPGFYYKNVNPWAQDFEFALDRQFGGSYLWRVAYVTTIGRHLLSAEEANPGNPTLCLSVSQPSQVMPGTSTCGPNGENGMYTTVSGTVINSTRGPFGPSFTSDSYFKTIGNSNYNSLQTSLRHRGHYTEFLAGYTYSKALDNASGYGEQVNLFNPNLKSLSSFDATQNLVTSYTAQLPLDKLASNRLTNTWAVSGVTRFSSGLPVTLLETDDNSLLGTAGSGPIQLPLDTPDFTPGALKTSNPRTGPYFNTALFSPEPLGQLGNARRRFFHGPGIDNWDINVQKSTKVTESTSLILRAEFFNAFNHTHFGSVQGNVSDTTNFGRVTTANSPRIMQFAGKFQF